MRPEPELLGLDEFREYMSERGLLVRRLYEWPAEDDEVGDWQVYLAKEEVRFDGKLYAQVITVSDKDVSAREEAQWALLVQLLELGFQRTLEENGVSNEDEHIQAIRDSMDAREERIAFLLDVVERLKKKDRALQDELKWNWEESARTRDALFRIADTQQAALAIIRSNGFVFEDIGQEPGNWQHLAFTLYSEICEVDIIARHALDIPLGENSDGGTDKD